MHFIRLVSVRSLRLYVIVTTTVFKTTRGSSNLKLDPDFISSPPLQAFNSSVPLLQGFNDFNSNSFKFQPPNVETICVLPFVEVSCASQHVENLCSGNTLPKVDFGYGSTPPPHYGTNDNIIPKTIASPGAHSNAVSDTLNGPGGGEPNALDAEEDLEFPICTSEDDVSDIVDVSDTVVNAGIEDFYVLNVCGDEDTHSVDNGVSIRLLTVDDKYYLK